MFPVAGEAMLYAGMWTLASSAFHIHQALQCDGVADACGEGRWTSGDFYRRLDDARSFTVSFIACSVVCGIFCIRIRLADREAYRDKLLESARKQWKAAVQKVNAAHEG
mmetsp:Transcript_9034/g.18074  ORF Transcript_9034/g.18074 Transcript_9034/m.18074 type:complete len:109 (-) Transcript_9034:227-553(-)